MYLTKEELSKLVNKLKRKDYNKSNCRYKNEDFSYWKSFDVEYDCGGDKDIGYQIAILFWDFSKHESFTKDECIGIQFEFLLGNDRKIDRLDLLICDDEFTIDEFELFCQGQYEFCKDIMHDILFRRENI